MFYTVHKGKNPGIYNNWDECKQQVIGFKGAIYKKFKDKNEAEIFLKNGKKKETSYIKKKSNNYILNLTDGTLADGTLADGTLADGTLADGTLADGTLADGTLIKKKSDDSIIIYTDGSLIRKNNNILCGYAYYIPKLNIKFQKKIEINKTNNRAELSAIIDVFNFIYNSKYKNQKIILYTDSMYCIYLLNKTAKEYKRNNYYYKNTKKNVPNKDLIIKLNDLIDNINFQVYKVKAHTNLNDIHSKSNSIVDELAKNACYL